LGARYFQQEGLEPKILVDATPRSAGQLLFQGQADVALLPPPMFLGMMAEDKPILLFDSLLANEPINLALRKSVADARKLSTHASLRDRLQAIRGLRIGLASEVGPRLRALFASAGMNADKDVQLITIAGPDQVKAFADDRIDVLFAHTPYLETVLVQHGAVLLVDTSGGEVPILADGQIHALGTTRALARSKPEMMAAVARARHAALKPFLKPHHFAIGSINSPMQCMMKEICAQCLQRHRDPVTGTETVVFSCFNQDQEMDRVDFRTLRRRLSQNGVQEKLTKQWIDRCLRKLGARVTEEMEIR